MTECSIYTLSEATEEYLFLRGVDKKKYFARYLVAAKRAWQEIFTKTLWVTKSTWEVMRKGHPYNYVNIPKDCSRLLSVQVLDDCGKLQPLYYNSQRNIVSLPTTKKCSCDQCNCGGLCEDLNSMTVTTRELFKVNAVTYYEKTWLKYCKNGDIFEYKEIPTKKFNDRIGGTSGDFNQDYNNDYSIGNSSAFANFEIVPHITQRKICSLTTKPCGCPEDTEENEATVLECCCGFLQLNGSCDNKICDQFFRNSNPNYRGEIKLSECGTRVYYSPSDYWKCVTGDKYPEYLMLNYQTDGVNFDSAVNVPQFAFMCLSSGIDWYSKAFNNAFSRDEKYEARTSFEHQKNEVIKYCNPISFQFLSDVGSAVIRW